MILNKRIRQLRLSNSLTAKEFGDIFDISYSSVSLYESGKRTPNINLIIEIAKYFNVSTDYLFGITSIPDSMPTYIQDSNLDIAKILEIIIHLINSEENLVYNDYNIDDQFANLLMKSITNLIETYTFLISNKHLS